MRCSKAIEWCFCTVRNHGRNMDLSQRNKDQRIIKAVASPSEREPMNVWLGRSIMAKVKEGQNRSVI